MTDRVLSMIGIAKKAGKVCSGTFLSEDAIRKGKAFLVIIAENSSPGTRKVLTDKSTYYRVPVTVYGTKEAFGGILGCNERSAVTILDEGIARKIQQLIQFGGIPNGEDQGQ